MSMRESVSRYRIVRTLGRGSMGLVYLAEDPLLNRQVAIKVVDRADEGSQGDLSHERLLRDAKAVANLSHPNIVSVFDVVQEGDSAFIVMEYIAGDSLAGYLRNLPLPEPAFSVRILRQMASALDYAHGKGVIHRDIKPGNVMLGPGGVAKIVDFGIARISDTRTSTPTGFMVGTAAYMSPEQFTGSATLDGRADQYSLAAMGYEMITGGTLFGEHTLPVLAYKAVNEMPEAVSARNPAMPVSVDAALNKALAKSPGDRYQNCTEFVDALDLAIAGQSIFPVVSPVASGTPVNDRATITHSNLPPAPIAGAGKRSNAVWWVAGLGALVVLGGAVGMWKPWVRASAPVAVNTASVPATAEPVRQPDPAPVTPSPVTPPSVTTPAAADTSPAHTPDRPPSVATAKSASKEVEPRVEPPARASAPETRTDRTPAAGGVEPRPASVPDTPVDKQTKRGMKAPNLGVADKLPPKLAEVFRHGVAQMKAQDYHGAIDSFSSVIAERPDHEKAFYQRAQAHQLLFGNEAAVKDYDEAIRLNPEDPFPYLGRGTCLVRLHRDEAALTDFNRALELKPDSPVALNGRGGVLLRRQQYERAIRDFTAALSYNPHFAPAYRNRAAARQAIGDDAGAKADLKAAANAKGQEPQ